jgi:filamentous hemagglutinin family protein
MSKSWLGCLRQIGLTICLAIGGAIASASYDSAFAQSLIIPDRTLGNESSRVIPSPFNNVSQLLTNGAVRGNNLFHSFLEFNVSEKGGAFFVSPSGNIQNIVARVTGSNRSQILGTLGTLQISNGKAITSNANLVLINPNGIVFGPNGRLNLGGSFVASTASAVEFTDGSEFSVTTPQTAPLLTVSVPLGLQFGKPAQEIQVQGKLDVANGKTLALVGGNVNLDGSSVVPRYSYLLYAPSGQIALGGTLGVGTIGLNLDSNNQPLTFPNNVALADVSFNKGAIAYVADINGDRGGNIQVQGRHVTLTERSGLFADTQSQNGRGISIQASQLTVQGGSQISASTSGAGHGGTITVNASDSVQVNGTYTNGSPSGLFTTTSGGGVAGSLIINTGQLIVQNGANVAASTDKGSRGSGGALKVTASSVKLSGTTANGKLSSGLFAQTLGSGDAGSLTIDTKQLIVENGAKASTQANSGSKGKGGDLTVQADSVELNGTGPNGQLPSGLFAQTQGSGDAGSLTINTGQLTVGNGAQVTVGSIGLGSGNAGNLEIRARSINLDQGKLTAGTQSSEGGNIALSLQDFLLLRHDSQISTSAGTALSGGNGGNITINTPNGFVVSVKNENSDIVANAFSGQGGKVNINATSIFNIAPLSRQELEGLRPQDLDPRQLPTNDITAISQTNPALSGQVNIKTPDIDPTRGLVELPINLIDAQQQISTACTPGSRQFQNTFVATGRGGLPMSPTEPLQDSETLSTWVRLKTSPENSVNTKNHSPVVLVSKHTKVVATTDPIVPATGWVFNNKGEVTLISDKSNSTTNNSGSTPSCDAIKR